MKIYILTNICEKNKEKEATKLRNTWMGGRKGKGRNDFTYMCDFEKKNEYLDKNDLPSLSYSMRRSH